VARDLHQSSAGDSESERQSQTVKQVSSGTRLKDLNFRFNMCTSASKTVSASEEVAIERKGGCENERAPSGVSRARKCERDWPEKTTPQEHANDSVRKGAETATHTLMHQ